MAALKKVPTQPLTASDDGFQLRRTIDRSVIDKLVESFKHFPRAVAQLVDNAVDWGATEIVLRFGKKDGEEFLSCIDNGSGFSDTGLHAMVSLGVSGAKDDPAKKGKNGTGAKASVAQCSRVTIETKRSDTPLLTIDYSIEQLKDIIFNGLDTKGLLRRSQLPPRHFIKTTGSVITWWGLNSRPVSKRTPEYLIEHLAEHLTPQFAENVVVEDATTGKRQRLQPRPLLGKRIRGDADVPGVGAVHYDLAVAAQYGESGECVKVTALGTGCSWQKFIEPIQSEKRLLKLLCADFMCNPHVMGWIDVPSWNKPYAPNSRDGFDNELYAEDGAGSTLLAFLKWVRLTLVPQITKELGNNQQTIHSDQQDRLLEEVVSLFRQKDGKPEVGTDEVEDVDVWDTSVHRILLERGEEVDIEILKPCEGSRYIWDATAAGGSVAPSIGSRVSFTAGNETGSFALMVREVGGEGRERQILVVVKEELTFAVTPPSFVLECGGEKRLRLRNTRHTCGRFEWVTANSGGSLVIDEDGQSAVYQAGQTPGEYTLTIEDQDKPDRWSTVCRVTVVEYLDKRRDARRNEFVIGNHRYRVEFASTKIKLYRSYLMPGDTLSTIRINRLHPAYGYAQKNKQLLMYYILNEIALRAAQDALGSSCTPSKLQERAAEILADRLPAA